MLLYFSLVCGCGLVVKLGERRLVTQCVVYWGRERKWQ